MGTVESDAEVIAPEIEAVPWWGAAATATVWGGALVATTAAFTVADWALFPTPTAGPSLDECPGGSCGSSSPGEADPSWNPAPGACTVGCGVNYNFGVPSGFVSTEISATSRSHRPAASVAEAAVTRTCPTRSQLAWAG